jgi:hypothetical protein
MVKFLVKPALQLLLLLLIFAHAKAQEALSVVPGQTFDAGSGKMSKLLVCDENNYYLLHLNDKGDFEINTGADASIEVFNKEMDHISTIPFRCPEGTKHKRFEPLSFIKINDGFLLLAKLYNTSQKLMKSFIFKISDDGLILLVKSIGEIEGIAVSNEKFHFFQLDKIIENDVSRFVYSQILPTDINVPERVSFIIYDENLAITGERLINFPDDILDYHLSQIVMSESGQAFFRIETTNPYQMDKTIHQLIIYDILNDKTQNLEFSPEGGEIAKATLKKVDNNTIGFFGYFTQKHDDPKPKGVLYYLFEAETGKLMRHEIYDSSPEIREIFNPKNLFSTSDYVHLMPQEIFLTSDNQVLLLFEFYWEKLMIVQDREGKPWTTPYFYANEIIVLSFDQADEFVNAGILPKEQLQANAFDLIGFSAFMAKNELIIIFNDNPKNAAEYRIEKLKPMKSGYSPMIAKYNYQKATYAKEILNTKNAGIIFEPGAIYKISDHSVIFLNQSRPFNLIEIRF